MKATRSSLVRRFLLAALVGGFFIFGLSFEFPFLSLPSIIGIIASLIMAAAAWFGLAFLADKNAHGSLLIGSICAIVAPIMMFTISGPGRTYYYKYIYPGGMESSVQTGTTGEGLVYIALIGLAGIIYWGWILAALNGWGIIRYGLVVFGSIMGVLLVIMAISAISALKIEQNIKNMENPSTVSLPKNDTYQAVIHVPECDGKAPGATTYLCIRVSGENQIPGGNRTVVLTEIEKAEYRRDPSSLSEVSLKFKDATSVAFQPIKGAPWKIGLYDAAKDYQYWQESFNGLNLIYQSTYYGPWTGRFEVLEFTTSDKGDLEHFAANFELTTSKGGTFSGYARYNSAIP